MITRVDLMKEIFRLRDVLEEFNGKPSDEVNYIISQIIEVVDNDDVIASHRFLKSFNDDIEKAHTDAVGFSDVKNSLVSFAEKKLFMAKTDIELEKLEEKSYSELEKIEMEEYAKVLENLRIFYHGKEFISETYKYIYGMNKEEMQNFFSKNGVKKSRENGYIGYLSLDMLKYHIVAFTLLNKECENQKPYIEEGKETVNSYHRSESLIRTRRTADNIKNLYQSNYNKTPFEDLKEGAFAQETIKGFYPNR